MIYYGKAKAEHSCLAGHRLVSEVVFSLQSLGLESS